MEKQLKTYEYQEYLVAVEATRRDSGSRWIIEIFVCPPDGNVLPAIKDADSTYMTLEDGFAAGFAIGKAQCYPAAPAM